METILHSKSTIEEKKENMNRGDHTKGEIELLKENAVFQNNFITVYNDDVIFPSGFQGTYLRVSEPNNDSVAILPVMEDGSVSLIHTFRHGMRGWGYEVPKGMVDPGETPEQAARRELLEEAGIVAGNIVYLGLYSSSPAVFQAMLHCFIAFDCREDAQLSTEKTEAIEKAVRMDAADIVDGIEGADYRDAMTELIVLKLLAMKSTRE